jgi:hypothetical protein
MVIILRGLARWFGCTVLHFFFCQTLVGYLLSVGACSSLLSRLGMLIVALFVIVRLFVNVVCGRITLSLPKY